MNHTVRNGILLFALIAIVTFCTVYFTIDFTTWHALTYFSFFQYFTGAWNLECRYVF